MARAELCECNSGQAGQQALSLADGGRAREEDTIWIEARARVPDDVGVDGVHRLPGLAWRNNSIPQVRLHIVQDL